MTIKQTLSFLALPAMLTFSSLSFAQAECTSDSECDENHTCEFDAWTGGCDSSGNCDPGGVSAVGTCIFQAPTCDSDADCGAYLSCQTYDDDLVCWASSDGSEGCEEPDPDAPKYCEPTFESCETDADCPTDFECEATFDTCIDIAIECLEGEECTQPTCEPSGGQCVPQTIDCDTDDACPSDWSCFEFVEESCGGEVPGVEPVEPGASDNGPTDGDAPGAASPIGPIEEPEPVLDECTAHVESVCVPDAWVLFIEADFGGGEAGADITTATPTSEGDAEEESSDEDGSSGESADQGGGCSVAQGSSGTGGWIWMLLFSAPLLMRRRRNA